MPERKICETCGITAMVQVTEVILSVRCVHHYCDEHVPGMVMDTALERHTRALIAKLEGGPHRHPERIAKLRGLLERSLPSSRKANVSEPPIGPAK
jgi:hypothetical protein